MRIAFRVDSSAAIGTGHLMRCLTLAQRLREQGADVLFVMRDLPGAMLKRPELAGFECAVLPPPSGGGCSDGLAHSAWLGTDQATDARETLAVLGNGVDWMVVDHYAIDRQWHSVVRQRAAKIMVIDDIADRSHDCDLLLDQNLQNAPDRYSELVGYQAQTLLGPRYALLRDRFAELRPRALAKRREKLERLLIFLGGVDAAGATLLALEAIQAAGIDNLQLDVVIGPANPDRDRIRHWCGSRPNVQLFEGGVELADLMLEADLSIGAAGSASWERCCMGLPTIVVTVAENQREGATALARAGAVIWAGDKDSIATANLAAILDLFRFCPDHVFPLADAAAKLVDGEGCRRVVQEMIKPQIAIRRAGHTDCDMVWSWRNDEVTRRWSTNPQKIPLEDHRAWFAGALREERRVMVIGEDATGPVGFVRFDLAEMEATVSIFLSPERHGRGLGSALLTEALHWLKSTAPQVSEIKAHVVAGNQQSARMFEATGFARCGEDFSLAINGDRK